MIARVLMAAAATLLPLSALAQEAAAPADSTEPAVVERTKPQQRGFSIARMGKPAPAAKKVAAVAPAKMAGDDMKDDAAPGKMTKHHARRHHRHHMRHHHPNG